MRLLSMQGLAEANKANAGSGTTQIVKAIRILGLGPEHEFILDSKPWF